MQSEVDGVASRVDRLRISRKPKRLGRVKSETEIMNLEDIKEFNVNRDYLSQHQPWAPNDFPREYLPHRETKWYPPVFCLGVALSLKETEDFARYLGLPVTSDSFVYGHGIAGYLTDACGAEQEVMLERCDQGGDVEDWIWVFSLVDSYDVSDKLDAGEPLRKYREIVEGAFGFSKQVMWWLEYTRNRSPCHLLWRRHKPEWLDGWDPKSTHD